MRAFSRLRQRQLATCIFRALIICLALVLSACALSARQTAPSQDEHDLSATSGGVVKIYVKETGMYQVAFDELINAGWRKDLTEPDLLGLYHRGVPVNFWIDERDSQLRLRFYGEESKSDYSNESIYWLVSNDFQDALWNKPDEDDQVIFEDQRANPRLDNLPKNTYQEHIRLEENSLYLPQIESGDHWMWVDLPAPATRGLEFELTGVAQSPGRLLLSFWARTQGPLEPDHHLLISINGNHVVDEYWDGRGWNVIETEIPAGILQEGMNQLEIESPGDTGVPADLIYLDHIQIIFARFPQVAGDQIMWESTGDPLFIEGFSDVYNIYDVTDAESASLEAERIEQSYEFNGKPGKRYLASGEAGYMQPSRLQPAVLTPNLFDTTNSMDYVAIGPEDLLEPLMPLMSYRTEEGFLVKAIELQTVYDQFTHGYPEPVAIQRMLRYARSHWQLPPEYLLLVGDGSYDPRGFISPEEANRLPTFLVQTEFGGETASDVDFVQLNDDSWPDIAIGRFPARNAAQVRTIVEKTLTYERVTSSGNNRDGAIVAIADGQSPSFQVDAQRFLDRFPEGYSRELYTPEQDAIDANLIVKRYFEGEAALIAYFGHGSVNMWGKDRLFTIEDVSTLEDNRTPPIVVNMTCLTGLFTHPKTDSLAEALLWRKNGGAVAVLAPSSLTLPGDQSYLSNALVDALLSNPGEKLGGVHLLARRQVPVDHRGALDVMNTLMLFGDPALQVRPLRQFLH